MTSAFVDSNISINEVYLLPRAPFCHESVDPKKIDKYYSISRRIDPPGS